VIEVFSFILLEYYHKSMHQPAGIVVASHATLATRNTPHFEDLAVPVVNPWISWI